MSAGGRHQVMYDFYDIKEFPLVQGTVDGTLISIKAPSVDEHLYVYTRANRHRPWHTNSSYLQTTATQIKFSCLLQLAPSPTLYQQTSSMETALSTLHQLNLLNSTHYTQWSTMSCTHWSLNYYPVKVKKYTTVTNLLKTTCQQHQLQLTPQTFFTDFETATRNSAQRAFTQATL